MSTIWKFDGVENKRDIRRHEDCMKKFFIFLREHAIKIICFEKRNMILLPKEGMYHILIKQNFPFTNKSPNINTTMIKERDHSLYTGKHRGAAQNVCNLKYSILKTFLWCFTMSLFHKGASKEFKEEFNYLGKNTKKYKIPISKEAKGIYKNEKKNKQNKNKNISYKLQFTDGARFMTSSLSNLVNNLADGIHKIKCRNEHDNKCETWGFKYKGFECSLEYTNAKGDLILYQCLISNKNCQKVHKIFLESLANIYKFSNRDINNFILLLQRGFYIFTVT